MKIYTLTCHDVYNYGASLQAYALMNYLENASGAEVTVIDYKPAYLSRHYYLWGGIEKYAAKSKLLVAPYLLLKSPGRLAKRLSPRKLRFDSFRRKYLKLTPKKYTSNEELRELPKGDCYFAGSDQIWNPVLENGNDPAFFLDFVEDDSRKISYSASFSVDSLTDVQQAWMKPLLRKFQRISVREKSGVGLLRDMGIDGALCTVDPVFLLEKVKWESMLPRKKFSEKYLFLYDFDHNPKMRDSIVSYAEAHKLKIYSGLKSDYADRCFDNAGPLEFLNLVRNAEIVISNSFHATAFSLIFHKPFYVFEREWAINARMRDLLWQAQGGTSLRIVKDIPVDETPILWNAVDENLFAWRKQSMDYLSECLKEVNR